MRRVDGEGPALYRGWMLDAARYADLADALLRRGITPRTTARRYRRAHELPGWYAELAAHTPSSVWTDGDGRAAFDRARAELGQGPAVLRDYTKSAKHHWHEAAFVPDTADADAAWAVAHDPPPAGLDVGWLAPLVAGLDLGFVTVDLARRADGAWRVVELGDGQVSDRPATVSPEELIEAISPAGPGSWA